MEHRLSRIATRSGDDGRTSLADGRRLSKAHARIDALGDVDELNSQIGLLLAEPLPAVLREPLARIQHELFDLGGELAWPGHTVLDEACVAALDADLARLNSALPPLREFILPGGSRAVAQAHVCRCVARRAERSVVALMELSAVAVAPAAARPEQHVPEEPAGSAGDAPGPWPQRYLNRLSDLLFVAARVIAAQTVTPEVYWRSRRLREAGQT